MEEECNVILEVVNLKKKYGEGEGETVALDDVSLKVFDGEFLVILGSSGSGKSTLLNIISGVDRSDSGRVIFKRRMISGYSESQLTDYRANNIGYIFQSFNLMEDLTAYSNIIVAPGANRNRIKAESVLNSVGLLSKKNRLPRQLSGGEQQRVAIARALNKPCEILVCDEPTGSLDYESGKSILSVLEKINKEQHKTIILVTHTKEISKMADRIVTMKNGKIISCVENSDKKTSAEVEW